MPAYDQKLSKSKLNCSGPQLPNMWTPVIIVDFLIGNIGQCMKYIIEIQRESFSDNNSMPAKSAESGPYFP